MKKLITILAIFFASLFIFASLLAVNLYVSKEAKAELFDAIKCNDQQTVIEILDKYPKLVNKFRYHVLFTPIDAPNSSPLITAIKCENLEMVKLLVERGADVNMRVYSSRPLHEAILMKEVDIVWYLIENGADISKKGGIFEETVLSCTLSRKVTSDDTEWKQDQFELFKYFIENGAPLDPPDGPYERIESLLALAAYMNNDLIVKYLLDHEVYDIDAIANPKSTQKTALMFAVQQKSYESCKILLEYGADKSIVDIDGKTAMDYALEMNDEQLISMLSD